MKKAAMWLPVLALLFCSIAGADATTPDVLVRNTTNEVLQFLRADKDFPKVNRHKIADKVEQSVLPHIDIQRLAQTALGDAWDDATEEQRDAVAQELHKLFAHTLTSALTQYDGQPVKFLPLHMQPDATEAEVTARVQVEPNDYDTVDFSMEKVGDEWMVYDITYEGVSMAKGYHSQFASIVKQVGVEGLIQQLQKKNGANESSLMAAKSKG